jgi:hypothetical protein
MNPNFKKKKPLPYKNLGELYTEAVEGEPSIGLVPTPQDPQGNIKFDTETIINSPQIKWSPEQKTYFKDKSKGGTGNGELSVAMLILQSKGITPTVEDLKKALQGGGHTFDVNINGIKYEVKQADVRKSVRTGKKGTAHELLSVLAENLIAIYRAYKKLSEEDKDRLDKKDKEINYKEKPEDMDGVERKVERSKEQFFRIVRPLEHLLQSAILYVASRELARGAVLDVKSQERVPKIYELPGLLRAALKKLKIKDSTLRNENNSVSLEDRLDLIQNMYTNNPDELLSRNKARLIDRQANSIATGKEDSAPVTLEEFEAVVDNSPIFNSLNYNSEDASEDAFKKEIQTVFTDTPNDMLQKILPVTGLFIVDEEGWTYAGYNNFNELVKIASITQGKYKLIPKNATEEDIAAAEKIPKLAV